jgi:excisionase family DNA binding protein
LTDDRNQGIMAIMDRPTLLSVAEAARRLGVTRQRVHVLIANSQLKAIRLGHYHFIEEVEVERYRALPEGRPYSPRSTIDKESVDKRQQN